MSKSYQKQGFGTSQVLGVLEGHEEELGLIMRTEG